MAQTDYPEEYIEAVFAAWYRAGAPGFMASENQLSVGGITVMNAIPKNKDGRKPNVHTIMGWAKKYGWRERADLLDAKVSLKFEAELVNERVRTLKRLAEGAETLLSAGLEYLKNNPNPFSDNASAAVRAIVSASEMVFKYSGAADKLTAIQNMSDKQLEREIYSLLGTKTNEDEDTVTTTLDDVPDEYDDNSRPE